MAKDKIYADERRAGAPFEFNAEVAAVFPDMLERSIPGYAMTIDAIAALARRFVTGGSHCYDLGCSLGAAALAMRDSISEPGCRIFAIDNSAAMVERCRSIVGSTEQVEISVQQRDIREIVVENASMVVMNYTLQFLPVADRDDLLRRICSGMLPGGVFVLSEKVRDDDDRIEALLVDLHHGFKRRNAYSELEISRKRAALEDVLIPESIATHRRRLAAAGFRHVGIWLRHYNFVSIVALR
ncbi:MAG: carboxy-S-adenosyl-L-methionine synthase CmoA [Gammaproteobacteria bacterium]|nr:carboxy-S-adenosyl-L-methionine synthase CmoA [Gammaproteobacteria bacterium]